MTVYKLRWKPLILVRDSGVSRIDEEPYVKSSRPQIFVYYTVLMHAHVHAWLILMKVNTCRLDVVRRFHHVSAVTHIKEKSGLDLC